MLNKIILKLNEHKIFHYLIIFFLIVFLYFPIIGLDRFLGIDDTSLIGPIEKAASFKDVLFPNKPLDIQPVRDISYYIDYKLHNLFQFDFYHLTNILILLLAGWTLFSILQTNASSGFLTFLIICYFTSHPIFSFVVPWNSSRKHLLAFVFTLFCTKLSLVTWKKDIIRKILLIISYVCAVLSQPIAILWPAWIIFHQFLFKNESQKKLKIGNKLIIFLSLLAICSIILQLWFYHYYKPHYVPSPLTITDNGIKKIPFNLTSLDLIFNSLGRYFLIFLIPFKQALYYEFQSPLNYFGLSLLIIFLIICFYKIPFKICLSILFFGYLPLAIVTFQPLTRYISNSYGLISFASFCAIVFILLSDFSKKYRKFIYLLLIAACIINITQTQSIVSAARESNTAYYAKSLEGSYDVLVSAEFILDTVNEDLFDHVINSLSYEQKKQHMKILLSNMIKVNEYISERRREPLASGNLTYLAMGQYIVNSTLYNNKTKLKMIQLFEDRLNIYSNFNMLVVSFANQNFETSKLYLNLIKSQLKFVTKNVIVMNKEDALRGFDTRFTFITAVCIYLDNILNSNDPHSTEVFYSFINREIPNMIYKIQKSIIKFNTQSFYKALLNINDDSNDDISKIINKPSQE